MVVKKRFLWLIISGCVLAVSGCEDDNSVLGLQEPTYTYEEFAVFDTTEFRFSRRDYPGSNSRIPEPLVNWEQSLGEPFTDVNQNGVYDAGIDQFVISSNPATNQDLNHNGRYDSPSDPWTPGIPFDDIDGNSQFRADPGDHISGYQLGLPYADFNLNQIHDGDLKAVYGVMKWAAGFWYNEFPAYYLVTDANAVYHFVSDSGLTYDLHFWFTPTMNALIRKPDGLHYNLGSGTAPILRPGDIIAEWGTEISVPSSPQPLAFRRTTIPGDTLRVDGNLYADLVKVVLEDTDQKYIFYFARGLGIFAYEYWQDRSNPPGMWIDYYRGSEYYFRRLDRAHSLVFPMTR